MTSETPESPDKQRWQAAGSPSLALCQHMASDEDCKQAGPTKI